MKCCVNCFKDNQIVSIIKSHNQVGVCDICGKEETYIYDTDKDEYLIDLFEGFFDIFVGESEIKKDDEKFGSDFFKDNMKYNLKNEIKNNWDIFDTKVTPYFINEFISKMCCDYFKKRPNLLSDKVMIQKLMDENYLNQYSLVGKYDWNKFVDSIKYKYRFHTDIFVKEVLKKYCEYLVKTIHKDTKYYRARISKSSGYNINEMSAPPKEIANAGRINPKGMSYLYLSDSKNTTIHEIRATLHDYVCIGEFIAKKDLKVIDLTSFDDISIFIDTLEYDFHAINKRHIKRINGELAKPVRATDGELEYLPTQYICDYIKSIPSDSDSHDSDYAYDGIMYKSTMKEDSYNIAIFNPDNFECVDKEVREISKVTYYSYIF